MSRYAYIHLDMSLDLSYMSLDLSYMSLDVSYMSLDVPHTPHLYAYHTPLITMPIQLHLAYLHMPTRPPTHTHTHHIHTQAYLATHTHMREATRLTVGYAMPATLCTATHAPHHSNTCTTAPHVLGRAASAPSVWVSWSRLRVSWAGSCQIDLDRP